MDLFMNSTGRLVVGGCAVDSKLRCWLLEIHVNPSDEFRSLPETAFPHLNKLLLYAPGRTCADYLTVLRYAAIHSIQM